MKILFIVYSELSSSNGIAKKIIAQCDGLRNNGLEVDLCHYQTIDGIRYWAVNGKPCAFIGRGFKAQIRHYSYFSPLIRQISIGDYDAVYIRYVHNATPLMLGFFRTLRKRGVKIILEIPTYPYDGEYDNVKGVSKLRVLLERHTRRKFGKYVEKIVTFSNDDKIFDVPTINLSNAVKLDTIPCRAFKPQRSEIRLVAVANLSFWHGYDRLIAGMGEYYRQSPRVVVHFNLVGSGELLQNYRQQAEELGVEKYIHFWGLKSGKELDEIIMDADLCIGCLGCHRKNITEVKSLKNVEYAAHGIPLAYSENNSDFDHLPFVIKLPASDSPIDINRLLEELKHVECGPSDIRSYVKHLSWDNQMKKVADYILSIN